MEKATQEWSGQRPQKWKTEKKHVAPPGIYGENVKMKVFSEDYVEPPPNTGKKHFTEKISVPYEEKPSIRIIHPEFGVMERVTGMKKIVENFTIVKPRTERVHFRPKPSEANQQRTFVQEKYRRTRPFQEVMPPAKIEQEKPPGEVPQPNRWREKVHMDAVSEEKMAVQNLIIWEKLNVKPSDPNYYDPDEEEDDD